MHDHQGEPRLSVRIITSDCFQRTFSHMGYLSAPGVHMWLIDSAGCQGYQVLPHASTRQSGKHLVVVHKLQWQRTGLQLHFQAVYLEPFQQLLRFGSYNQTWIDSIAFLNQD